jgi:hypothetical protein
VSWFDKIVDAVRTAAVSGERIERLGRSVADLAIELRELDRRVSRLEGAVAARATMASTPIALPAPREK